jgi:predicted N-acetyltransferase YhbS
MTCAAPNPFIASEQVDVPAVAPAPRSVRLRAAKPEARRLNRRRVYLGEGLTLQITAGEIAVQGEVIDLTPAGIGVAIVEGEPSFAIGDVVTVLHTGPVTSGLRQRAVVRSISVGTFAGRTLPRVGLSFVLERTVGEVKAERRRASRYPCAETFTPIATAMSPLFFREWLHFEITQIAAGGVTMTTSIRNKGLLPNLEFDFEVTLPVVGRHQVRGRITSVLREGQDEEFTVGVAWIDPPRAFAQAVSEFLMLGDKTLTPSKLREEGFVVGSVERAMTYDYASLPNDYEEILRLRLTAHQHEGRHKDLTEADVASPYDAFGRHFTCRFGRRIVAYVRLLFVEKDASRSQYVSLGGHEVPAWLWEEGFVEAGAGAVDPEFKRAGLFLPLMQHAIRVARQSGYRYVLGAADDELLAMYREMGFEVLETRNVEPKPGWNFDSHLFYLDIEKLTQKLSSGRNVEAMAEAASFGVSRP